MPSGLRPIQSPENRVSPEEWEQRVNLAAAYRVMALYGWDDLIFTHLSARVPGPEHHYLVNSYGMMFEEITASSLVKIDVDGNKIDDGPGVVFRQAFVIHGAIHQACADAGAVMHLHTLHGQAVAAMKDGLLPHSQTAMTVYEEVAYHDLEGFATDLGERERIVADLGQKKAMILRNHGTLTIGETVPEAFVRMYQLERACEIQVHALGAVGRAGLNEPNQGVVSKVGEQARAAHDAGVSEKMAWPALLRKLDRIDPTFRT
jgi:ribulose-5-phosphate 4-epimerase/fuculose-1-phosphate aldolase